MKNIISFILEKLLPFNVYIMVGLPGSGKSTWIKNNLSKDIEIINQDAIRVELGIMDNVDDKKIGDKQQEKEVSKINDERVEKLIKDRKDFVIDNTNVKAGRVENYYNRLKKAGANVKIILVDTDAKTCYDRRKKDIPENVINQMDLGVQKVKKQFKDNEDLQIVHNKPVYEHSTAL